MTHRSHKIAITALFVLVLITAIVILSRSAAADGGFLPSEPYAEDCLISPETIV